MGNAPYEDIPPIIISLDSDSESECFSNNLSACHFFIWHLMSTTISIKPSMQTALKSLLCTAAVLKHESESNVNSVFSVI